MTRPPCSVCHVVTIFTVGKEYAFVVVVAQVPPAEGPMAAVEVGELCYSIAGEMPPGAVDPRAWLPCAAT